MRYPESPRGDVVDTLHGTEVADPYRWLEDPDAPETRAWIAAQNELTRGYLEAIPEREAIRARLTTLWNHERWGLPAKRGGRWFFTRNDGLQDQEVLCVADDLDADAQVLLDPNQLSEDGTVALANWMPSGDGRLVAWATSDGGSDWRTWRVRDVQTGEDLPEAIRWSKFSTIAWAPDDRGFYYADYPPPTGPEQLVENQRLRLHRLGTSPDDDPVVYARPDHPAWGFQPQVTEDGTTLVIDIWEGSARRNRVYLLDLTRPDAEVTPLLDAFDAYYIPLGKRDRTLWFGTNQGAARGRIIRIDLDTPDRAQWTEVVPEAPETLSRAALFGEVLLVEYLRDAHSVVRRYTPAGASLGEVDLPGLGTTVGFEGRSDDPETAYVYTDFVTPPTVFVYDTARDQSTLFRRPTLDFDGDRFTTEQVLYESADGTRIPMFLVHRRDSPHDGDQPVLLYGYGGFNLPLTPGFKVANAVWLELGGVLAVANLRGGGEYGRTWHEGGILDRKQNVFDDFAAAARWLVDQGWTRPERLAIQGRSNGGLLVAATLLQHPDLFGAALPGVGVLDMLRYHRFTIGCAWASDYGTAEDPEQFETLLAYSPVHNAVPTAYPPTLIVTADHDDRVVPAHSYKFAAAMQHAQRSDAPILIRVETRAGHGALTPTSLRIAETTDEWAFLCRTLQMTPELPG